MDYVYDTTSHLDPHGLHYLHECHQIIEQQIEVAVSERKVRRCGYFEGLGRWEFTIALALGNEPDHIQKVLSKTQVWSPKQMEGLTSLAPKESVLMPFADAVHDQFQQYRKQFIALSERRDEIWMSDAYMKAPTREDENSGERIRRLCLEDESFRSLYDRVVDSSISKSIHKIAQSTLDDDMIE